MENTNRSGKESNLAIVATVVASVALLYGSYVAYKHLDEECSRELEAEYGYLRAYPEEYRKEVLTADAKNKWKWSMNADTRYWYVSMQLRDLKRPAK